MEIEQFFQSLESDSCPEYLDPYLSALWYDARGDWDKAHRIVQNINDKTAARIHAYLHRKEGDISNALYWHRRAGTRMRQQQSLNEEWHELLEQLIKR